jgi:ribosomal protein S27AE
MSGQVSRREVRCPRCGWWWHHPKEPIHFASWDEWGEEHPEKETLFCPNCGEVAEVSGENVRFTKVEEGKRGKSRRREE